MRVIMCIKRKSNESHSVQRRKVTEIDEQRVLSFRTLNKYTAMQFFCKTRIDCVNHFSINEYHEFGVEPLRNSGNEISFHDV